MQVPFETHATFDPDSRSWVRTDDDDGSAPWAELRIAHVVGIGHAEGLAHTKTQKLGNVFLACARDLLKQVPGDGDREAGARVANELERVLLDMRAEVDAFVAAHATHATRVANHLEVSHRAAYRFCVYALDRFCAATHTTPTVIVHTMEGEYPELRDDFPKFQGDVRPVDLTERSAREHYGPQRERLGYLHRFTHFMRSNYKSFFPPLIWLPQYAAMLLLWDVVAGITVGVFVVAQGIAYALLAGLPPQAGLYSATVPTLIYAFLGTSRQMSVGPFALIALLVNGALAKIPLPANATTAQTTAALMQGSASLMLYCGLFLLVFGLLRMGFIANFISRSFLAGFSSASGIIIQTSQLPALFGEVGAMSKQMWIDQLIEFFSKLPKTHWPTLLTGLIALAVLIVLEVVNTKKLVKLRGVAFPIPAALLVCVLGMIIAWATNFVALGIKVIGTIPAGFNTISVPNFDLFALLWLDALITALIVFLTSAIITARYADEHGYAFDASQEQLALGVANIAGSFFSGFVVCGAMSRSAVSNAAGARSPIFGLIGACIVILVLMVATPALYWMPNTILAATIIMAAYGLWDFALLRDLWRVRKSDLVVWWVSFLATLFVGSQTGLLIALAFSIVLVVYRASTPHIATLGRLPRTTAWRDVSRFPDALVIDGLLVLRIDSDFFFANIGYIHRSIVHRVMTDPKPVHVLILDFSAVSDIDYTAVAEMSKTFKWLGERSIRVLATAVTGPVRDLMKRSEFINLIGPENIYWLHQDAARVAKEYIREAQASLADAKAVDLEDEPETSDTIDESGAGEERLRRLASISEFGGDTRSFRYEERGKTQVTLGQKFV